MNGKSARLLRRIARRLPDEETHRKNYQRLKLNWKVMSQAERAEVRRLEREIELLKEQVSP